MKEKILTIGFSTILSVGIISSLAFRSSNETGSFVDNEEVPIGTIVAWSGDPAFLPANWKVCDGLTMAKDQFPELYRVIADNWTPDQGVNKDLFKIPDLRGLFLRGVSGTRNDEFIDPEKDGRIVLGNSESNEVGSIQRQSTRLPTTNFTGRTSPSGKHTHNLPGHGGGKGVEHGVGSSNNVTFGDYVHSTSNIQLTANDHNHTLIVNEGGDIETRPINAYIHWIVKVK
ncbi:MAG: phage tail protein [Cyclobacteriaceae bacterium]|nr:tail fiber protein [Cyclobacteriaceae bacterium]